MATGCGDTNERTAAWMHGAVLALYVVMSVWHGISVAKHYFRYKEQQGG